MSCQPGWPCGVMRMWSLWKAPHPRWTSLSGLGTLTSEPSSPTPPTILNPQHQACLDADTALCTQHHTHNLVGADFCSGHRHSEQQASSKCITTGPILSLRAILGSESVRQKKKVLDLRLYRHRVNRPVESKLHNTRNHP